MLFPFFKRISLYYFSPLKNYFECKEKEREIEHYTKQLNTIITHLTLLQYLVLSCLRLLRMVKIYFFFMFEEISLGFHCNVEYFFSLFSLFTFALITLLRFISVYEQSRYCFGVFFNILYQDIVLPVMVVTTGEKDYSLSYIFLFINFIFSSSF